MKYVLRYTMADGVDFTRVRELFPEHRRHWESYRENGTLVAIGPMEDPADGALSVFTTREAAEEFAASDPFVTSGVVGTWDVAGWREAIL
ncbi:MAG TPA: YciI family protein [Propionibacteriaceae bacterium]|nr:YciI family protein [Propionibacteriaceae bacterium]